MFYALSNRVHGCKKVLTYPKKVSEFDFRVLATFSLSKKNKVTYKRSHIVLLYNSNIN